MEFSRYFRGILRWWWLIILSTGIAGAVSYIVTSQQPVLYATSTTIMVGQVFNEANPTTNDIATSERLAESYAQIARRQPILQATVESLGLPRSWQALRAQVWVQQVPRTQLLEVSASDISPELAMAIADELARQIILQSPSSPENQARQERGPFIQNQLNALETRIQGAQSRIDELQLELNTAFSARQIQELQTEINNLNDLIRDWQSNYAGLLGFLQGGEDSNYLTIIEPAQIPYPVGASIMTNVILAAAAGLSLAVGAAFLLVYLDDTIKLSDELDYLGLTGLGNIQRIKGQNYQDKLSTISAPFSPESEAYRVIRSNIQFAAIDQPPKSIVITSPEPGAGKSTTASNLAVILAQAELKTILIDADLRRPVLHKIFNVPNLNGLTDLLRSPSIDLNNSLNKTSQENLYIIPSGPLPPNPAELLSSRQISQLLHRLEQLVDIVIIDSPPTLAVSDTIALSSKVDGVILVARKGSTRRKMIQKTIANLHQVGGNILGGVLNYTSDKQATYGYYYGRYTYDAALQTGIQNGSGRHSKPSKKEKKRKVF